ncbi:hypothetical protein PVAND_017764, partial [Polypedilum vanderplanki]
MPPSANPVVIPQTVAQMLQNPEQLRKWKKDNPGSEKIKTYIFHHTELQSDILCSQCEEDVSTKEGNIKVKGKRIDGQTNLIWCINCDEVDHLVCLEEDGEFTDKDAPYICS